MKILLWLLVLVLLPFQVTIRAEDESQPLNWSSTDKITIGTVGRDWNRNYKCIYGDVPDTLWQKVVKIDTICYQVSMPYGVPDNLDLGCAIQYKLSDTLWRCCFFETTWEYKFVVLQPCPEDVIIDKDTFPALDSFPLATDDLTERKLIEHWMEWLEHETYWGDATNQERMDGVSWRTLLAIYLYEKEK